MRIISVVQKNEIFILFSQKYEMSLKWLTIYSIQNDDDNFISKLK